MSKYIDKEELWERLKKRMVHHIVTNTLFNTIKAVIDGMPTIEVSEDNQVLYGADHNCILTMFGECSYNETGCGDCAVAEKIRKALSVEVSEDCISKHDIWKIIEDNAYWVRYNENSTEKGMTLTGINQALNECPPVIPTVSEDCSDYYKGYCARYEDGCFQQCKNAPSVVLSITEDRDTQILDNWQVHHRNTTSSVEGERSKDERTEE